MGLLASTFNVKSVVFFMRGSHFLVSMGLEGDLGMGLLALTFDVESVVFLRRGSQFLAFYVACGRFWDVFVGVNFRYRKCCILYAGLTLFSFAFHGAGG